MKKLLKTVNQALDLFDWNEPVKDAKDQEIKPGYYSFKLKAIEEESTLYRVISDILHDLNLDENSSYEFIHDTLVAIQERLEDNEDPEDYDYINEQADSTTPIYTFDLLEWLAKDLQNYGWVEEAVDEYGWQGSMPNAIMMGYARAWTNVYNEVLSALQEYLKK